MLENYHTLRSGLLGLDITLGKTLGLAGLDITVNSRVYSYENNPFGSLHMTPVLTCYT